ncbi:MAG: hypothetical protein ACP6KW_05270 [Candidatus Thorarchaeota archaeon]
MPKNGKEEKTLVRFEYEYDPEFREFYVTGARGGIQNVYHLTLDFYEEKTELRSMTDVLIEYPDGSREVRPAEPPKGVQVVNRKFKVGLVMSFNAARELASFLNDRIREIDEMEKKISKEIDAGGDKSDT